MPHDVLGRLIEVGDTVQFTHYTGESKTAVVTKVLPGATTCNLTVGVLVPSVSVEQWSKTAGEVALLAKGDGTPVPAGIEPPVTA